MAGRDLGEAGRARQGGQAALVLRKLPRMHQHDGAGADARRTRLGKGSGGAGFIERFDLTAVDADAAANLDHALVEHARKSDIEVEQTRPCLVADPKSIGEPSIDYDKGALALAFEQRVGGHGSAHLYRFDHPGRDARFQRDAEHRLDTGDRRVAITARILAKQLVRRETPIRCTGDNVGEGPAPIDPELPTDAPCVLGLCHRRSTILLSWILNRSGLRQQVLSAIPQRHAMKSDHNHSVGC
jgi:hypothetical protein